MRNQGRGVSELPGNTRCPFRGNTMAKFLPEPRTRNKRISTQGEIRFTGEIDTTRFSELIKAMAAQCLGLKS